MIRVLLSPAATRWGLFLAALALTGVGVLFVHSTTALEGEEFPGSVARKQILRAGVALAALAVVVRWVDYRFVERRAYVFYWAMVAFLSALLAVKYLRGDDRAIRWFRFVLFDVQPSELMKLAVVLCLARYLRFRDDQRSLGGLVMPYVLTLVPMVLVLLQPDLGTSLLFVPVLLGMLFVAGARARYLVLTIALALAVLPAAYFLGDSLPILHEYQLRRVTAYFEQHDPAVRSREAYQLDQSEVAIGSGGLFGRGLGRGSQNLLGHLPAKHTDFIFSIIGEESGFVGASSVVVVFLFVVLLSLRVALYTREPFGRLVAAGIAVAFAAQSFQNIGMTMGLLPITGVPLPFVSYGGSSLVASYLALALVMRVASQRVTVVASKDLDPEDRPRVLAVEDPRPAGSLVARWPV
jgi:rod shape determining protein RodA